MNRPTELRVSAVASLAGVDAAAWDSLVGSDNPFVEHAFLHALEQSDSVGERTGWYPQHLLVHHAQTLVGALPLYVKDNSYGEYIFDWGWANAAQRAGIPYYPKLVCAVPFTPASGPRLIAKPELDGVIQPLLAAAMAQLSDTLDCSSAHVLFCQRDEQSVLSEAGFLPRLTYQYHWVNEGYASFDDYLSRLRSAARKQILRERRRAHASGLQIAFLPGAALSPAAWAALYRFYRCTVDHKWGSAYLTEAFFESLQADLVHRVRVALAQRGETPVAAALYFEKGGHLYGRYWGTDEAHDCLHFELCYYQAIAYCIDNRLARFEAGAQGEHKIKRGLLPHPTYSAHYIRQPELREAIDQFLRHEARAHRLEMQLLRPHGPFRRGT